MNEQREFKVKEAQLKIMLEALELAHNGSTGQLLMQFVNEGITPIEETKEVSDDK